METYALESAVLRARKRARAVGPEAAALHIAAVRCFAQDALDAVEVSARRMLAAALEGEALEAALAAVRRFTARPTLRKHGRAPPPDRGRRHRRRRVPILAVLLRRSRGAKAAQPPEPRQREVQEPFEGSERCIDDGGAPEYLVSRQPPMRPILVNIPAKLLFVVALVLAVGRVRARPHPPPAGPDACRCSSTPLYLLVGAEILIGFKSGSWMPERARRSRSRGRRCRSTRTA